ncbi:hypothetical protein [Anaerofustis stercorihominis]|uniref:hypothetical protein n=1 Tax=Anaerofustis stercorihominis TaxID=214853 RepID=UPI002672C674|nr:hypothetical protein [Anaerofustis stercorihominis]
MRQDRWSEYEIKYLKENWGKMPTAKIAARLGRNDQQIRAKAYSMKLKRDTKKKNKYLLQPSCRGCIFLSPISGGRFCNYIAIMGKPRGCSVLECDKRVTKSNAPKNILKKLKRSEDSF